MEVIILAAGKGTRMRSSLPKVLHRLAGKPLLGHVIDTALTLEPTNLHVVVGHGGQEVTHELSNRSVNWVFQEQQLGTGHAVLQAIPYVADGAMVLILYGDVPLIDQATLRNLLEQTPQDGVGILTVVLDDPTGYGRIVREDGVVTSIVEQKDASADQLQIREVNTGILCVSASNLHTWLPKLSSGNAQGEYYLTDIVSMATRQGHPVIGVQADSISAVQGVNDRLQLANLEREYQRQQAERLLLAGVMLMDPVRFDLRGSLKTGQDIVIDVNCVFSGDNQIDDGVSIGANCVIRDAIIEAGAVIHANTVIEGPARIGAGCSVGPFARIRPDTVMAAHARIGNFVETKKAQIAEGAKINHLSYIGDAAIGAHANIGAGTITCNYDGVNKSRTIIGEGAFIGSNASLVAPVTIGAQATVGAGSVVTHSVADGELAVARGKQRNISGWQRPVKKG